MASKKKIPAGGVGDPSETPEVVAPPLDAITRMELFLEKHWRGVVSALALLVGVVIVYFYMKYKKEDTMTESNNALTAAVARSDFEAVLKKHPGTAAAGTAMYQIADRQLAASEFDAAGATLEKFIADFPKHPLHYNALLGLGNISEKAGDLDKAEGYFKQVIDAGDKSSLVPLATIYQAELLIAKGELDKAKEIYDSFGPNFSGSPFVQKASERLAALEVRIKRQAAPKAPVEPEPEAKPEDKTKPVTPTPGAPNTPAPITPAPTTPAPITPAPTTETAPVEGAAPVEEPAAPVEEAAAPVEEAAAPVEEATAPVEEDAE